jgi:hypothetical protein
MAKKISALEAPLMPTAPAPQKPVAKPVHPETVATRSYVGGPWDPFIKGQVPGPNGVIAIKFADGSEWDLGYGWLNK